MVVGSVGKVDLFRQGGGGEVDMRYDPTFGDFFYVEKFLFMRLIWAVFAERGRGVTPTPHFIKVGFV